MRTSRWTSIALLLAAWLPALGAEFRSVAESAAVLYDAPSVKSRKLYVIGRSYPVEIVVVVDGWSKIRDVSGELAWIESRDLSERRTVLVKAKLADVRQSAADTAPLVFQAEQSVLFDLIEITAGGWARVAHRDGQGGYVKLSQLWGL
jgi:SH3-like domain-containing protein